MIPKQLVDAYIITRSEFIKKRLKTKKTDFFLKATPYSAKQKLSNSDSSCVYLCLRGYASEKNAGRDLWRVATGVIQAQSNSTISSLVVHYLQLYVNKYPPPHRLNVNVLPNNITFLFLRQADVLHIGSN